MILTVQPKGTKRFLNELETLVRNDNKQVLKEIAIYASNNIASEATFPIKTKDKKLSEKAINRDVGKIIHYKHGLAAKFKKSGRSSKQSNFFVFNLLKHDESRVERIASNSRIPFVFSYSDNFESTYFSNRDKKTGKVKRNSMFQVARNEKKIKKFAKQRQKLIGLTKSGWIMPQSNKRFPAWIKKHGNNGKMVLTDKKVAIINTMRAANYATSNSLAAQKIQRAIKTVIQRHRKVKGT